DILTKDPEVWKKTIFILCYDENDGYFDHFPPFVPAHPNQPETGLNSKGLDTTPEFVTTEQESKRSNGGRTGPIGLGFRVPLVIASPWSRGGFVNSEVFDHTSILQFMELFLSKKTGKPIKETNISDWRRTVCGDLTSVFRPYTGEKMTMPKPVPKQEFYEGIHKAQFKKLPEGFKALNEQEIEALKTKTANAPYYQEKGIRPSNALPYELYSDAKLKDGKLQLTLSAKNKTFGKKAAGSPFHVYEVHDNDVSVRHYTVMAGDSLTDTFSADYPVRVYGPNGFFREFKVNKAKNRIDVSCLYNRGLLNNLTGDITLQLANTDDSRSYTVQIIDNGYGAPAKTITLAKAGSKGSEQRIELDLKRSYNWYDVSVKIDGIDDVAWRYAGRVETGKTGFTDPLIGREAGQQPPLA
ncbi:alkaline phosphatase family protein, partial [Arsenicibacter rosenii]|uniref:alkaline phosphatase family protein n=1 Tax=Arsenicibacter rosenii TaxID=1750698 RepID=UPI000AF2DC7A